MWLSESGAFNTVRAGEPAEYLAPSVIDLLRKLDVEELIKLDLELREYRDVVIEQVMVMAPENEAEYEGEQLPLEYSITQLESAGEVLPQLIELFGQTPLRWRLERADLISQYITDHGPSFRRYARTARRLLSSRDRRRSTKDRG